MATRKRAGRDLRPRVGGHDGVGEREDAALAGDRAAMSSGNLARIFSAGSRTPMMPVEEGKTSAAGTPNSFPASRQTLFAGLNAVAASGAVGVSGVHDDGSNPSAGRKQSRAANFHRSGDHPVLREQRGRRARSRTACHARPTSARSGRPLTLMPAATAEKENPSGKRIFSGEAAQRGHA